MSRVTAVLIGVVVLAGVNGSPVPLGELRTGATAEVVVVLESPPLAYEPHGGARIAQEQHTFRRALAAEVPAARVGWRYRLVANGFSLSLPADDVSRVRALPRVREVFPTASYAPQLDRTPAFIGAPAIWGAALEPAGAGMKIGIIDSGIDPRHPFFDATGYTFPPGFPKGQQRFTTAKVIVARAFPPKGAKAPSARVAFDPDDESHGTHVAGIAAGNPQTRASGGRAVSGVAPRAYIGNYKVFVETDDGISPNANSPAILAAVEAAVADGMDVINFSGGQPEIEPSRDIVARALDAAAAAGVVPVVAAGNDFSAAGAGSVSSPANSERAITVGAIEIGEGPARGTHADFSSVGPTTISLRLKPDVAAPGVDVLSAVPGGWAVSSGTSMAAPHVSGAAALLAQRHPEWTVAQIKSALVQSASDTTDEAGRAVGPSFQGGGVVSLAKADRPLVFAEPAGVSFGLRPPGSTLDGTIALSDAGGGAGTWQVTLLRATAPADTSLVVPQTVEVPGELRWQVVTSPAATQGEISGYLVLRLGTDERRVPFWGRVAASALTRHQPVALGRAGTYRGNTAGRPKLVTRYRYPENPTGLGVTRMLSGPELVYVVRIGSGIANFGVVVTRRTPGARVEPRVVAELDENRLTGYAGLPVNHNPYLESFRDPVLAAGALSPAPGRYAIVFDSATSRGAGTFTFRFWTNDTAPPSLRLRTRVVASGTPLRIAATDAGSGVYPDSIEAAIDGRQIRGRFREGVITIPTTRLDVGSHRLRLRVSDYQESKNTENVARILPNTRTVSLAFRVR